MVSLLESADVTAPACSALQCARPACALPAKLLAFPYGRPRPPEGARYRPYDLVVVPRQEVRDEYLTVSATGVVRIRKGAQVRGWWVWACWGHGAGRASADFAVGADTQEARRGSGRKENQLCSWTSVQRTHRHRALASGAKGDQQLGSLSKPPAHLKVPHPPNLHLLCFSSPQRPSLPR